MGFPKAIFFERFRNPDQLDGTGRDFASRRHKRTARVQGCFGRGEGWAVAPTHSTVAAASFPNQ